MSEPPRRPLVGFFALLLGLAVLHVLAGLVALPLGWLPSASIVLSILFVGIPVLALYLAAAYPWTARASLVALTLGVIVHLTTAILADQTIGLASSLLGAMRQIGLLTWCLGLGSLLVGKIKEKGLLLPIAATLILLDIFLILSPAKPAAKFVQQNPQAFAKIAYEVPRATASPTSGRPEILAHVGPADFLFLAMFFTALFRFRMRVRETFLAMVPTLLAYLLIVVLLGHVRILGIQLNMLPALVPIGLCVLWVNRKELALTPSEKRDSAIAIGAFAALLVLIGFLMSRAQPAEPLPSGLDQAPLELRDSPAPASSDQSR